MKNLSKLFILLAIVLLGVSSCGSDEPDGKWEKMKWHNVANLMNQQGVYLIPEEGGTFVFQCRNYSNPWITSVTVDGVSISIDNSSNKEYNGEWCTVKFEGSNLSITAQPLPASVERRNLDIRVTAGDIFDTLPFAQQRGIHL
ncbi:MAG: hypothetical protein IJG42_12760 [Muribaculaceae bacterium]|nr:hypothetical protein [Muribaculaceae bacterium]